MRNNIVTAVAGDLLYIKTNPVFQYDHGLVLMISGVTLPEEYDVHFCNTNSRKTKSVTGDSTGVLIPDEYLISGEDIQAYLYLHTDNEDGESVYHIQIPVIERAAIGEEEITPIEHDVIKEAIKEMEENVKHYPYINDNGYWMLYDATQGQFVNTGVNAEGSTSSDIDDTAGAGDTDKTWSANKLTTKFGNKADKADTVLDTTLSRGRAAGSTVGQSSFAFGESVVASGSGSVAFGGSTVASGDGSFAANVLTTASGDNSAAFGGGAVASGMESFAEGIATKATGTGSHAGGMYLTQASGEGSYAFGYMANALGDLSHAEGYATCSDGLGMVAVGAYNYNGEPPEAPNWVANTQYEIGDRVYYYSSVFECIEANNDSSFDWTKWNQLPMNGSSLFPDWQPNTEYDIGDHVILKDDYWYIQPLRCVMQHTSSTDIGNDYDKWIPIINTSPTAFVIGNGYLSPESEMFSNAMKVNWNGDQYLMGDLYVGCDYKSENGSKVAKLSDIPAIATTAETQAIISEYGGRV